MVSRGEKQKDGATVVEVKKGGRGQGQSKQTGSEVIGVRGALPRPLVVAAAAWFLLSPEILCFGPALVCGETATTASKTKSRGGETSGMRCHDLGQREHWSPDFLSSVTTELDSIAWVTFANVFDEMLSCNLDRVGERSSQFWQWWAKRAEGTTAAIGLYALEDNAR